MFRFYKLWFDDELGRLMQSDSIFGILLVNSHKEDVKKEKLNFISVLIVNPELSRIGFASFLPEIRLNKEEKSLEELILSGSTQEARHFISQFLTIEVPFYIKGSNQDIANAIDLTEGLDYFIDAFGVSGKDRMIKGEFLLDGALLLRLMNVEEQNEYSSAFQIYKYYSLILNLWLKRNQKWDIIKDKRTFGLITQNLESNLMVDELYFIARTFLEEGNWLPLFWEVPVKKDKNIFLVNKEAAALYFRDFKAQITQKKHKIFNSPPSFEIRNGTNVPNLAKKVRGFLSKKGFRVLEFQNADSHNYKHSILLDINAKPFYLQSVANTLKIDKYYFAINRTIFTDLVLILGEDYPKIFSEER